MQERLRQLEVATAALITDVSLDGVLRRVVEVAAQVIGARYAAIGVIGPGGKVLESFTRRTGSTRSSRKTSGRRRAATAFSAS